MEALDSVVTASRSSYSNKQAPIEIIMLATRNSPLKPPPYISSFIDLTGSPVEDGSKVIVEIECMVRDAELRGSG